MISNGGTTTLGLYDLKRKIDAFGGVDYFRPNLVGGYLKNARVMLDNGDIVKSTIDGNANDPNVNMTGWVKDNSASQIFDASGKTQQEINDSLPINFSWYNPVAGENSFDKLQQAYDDHLTYKRKLVIDVSPYLICPDGTPYQEPKLINPDFVDIECLQPIYVDNKSSALRIERTIEIETTITDQSSVLYPVGQSGNYVTRLTVFDTTGFENGRTVLCHSNDLYNTATGVHEEGSEKAQLVEIMYVDSVNKYIYLRELLYETLTTNPKVAQLRKSKVNVNLKTEAYGDITNLTLGVPTSVRDVVVEDFGIDSTIKLESRTLWSGGIGLFSCFRGEYQTTKTIKSRNYPTLGSYPYGINVGGASRFCDLYFKGAGVRHAVTNTMRNSVVSGELRKKGRQADITASGSAKNTLSASWDTHPFALRWTFKNTSSLFPSVDFNAVTTGQQGTQIGYQDRGESTKFINPEFVGNGLMFNMSSKNVSYNKDYTTKIINPISDKLKQYSDVGLRLAWMSFSGVGSTNTDKQTIEILGGYVANQEKLFDYHNASTLTPLGKNLAIKLGGGLKLHNVDKIETSNKGENTGNSLTIDGVTRSCDVSKTLERIYAYADADLRILNYTIDLRGASTTAVAVASGDGAASIFIGNIVSSVTANNFVDVATSGNNTPSVTYSKYKPSRALKVYDTPSIAAGASVTTTVTGFTGLTIASADTSVVKVSLSGDPQGLHLEGWISGTNIVTVRLTNPTGAAIDLPSMTLLVSVERWT